MSLTRRSVLKIGGLGIIGAAGIATAGSASHDTGRIVLEEHKIAFATLPLGFEGYRIGFISDIHLGRHLPTEWLEAAVEQLRQSNIDLLLLGGDYIWLPDPEPMQSLYPVRNPEFASLRGVAGAVVIFERVADITSSIAPKDGIAAVLGNHDTWCGWQPCVKALNQRGIHVLENAQYTIERKAERLIIFGVQDYWTGVPSLPTLSPRIESSEFRILLTHNPDYTSELLRLGRAAFQFCLSGHTHGGQICVPGLGPLYANVEDTRFAQGFFQQGDCLSYTSRGLGVVEIPYRVNCPAEISVFELSRA